MSRTVLGKVWSGPVSIPLQPMGTKPPDICRKGGRNVYRKNVSIKFGFSVMVGIFIANFNVDRSPRQTRSPAFLWSRQEVVGVFEPAHMKFHVMFHSPARYWSPFSLKACQAISDTTTCLSFVFVKSALVYKFMIAGPISVRGVFLRSVGPKTAGSSLGNDSPGSFPEHISFAKIKRLRC